MMSVNIFSLHDIDIYKNHENEQHTNKITPKHLMNKFK